MSSNTARHPSGKHRTPAMPAFLLASKATAGPLLARLISSEPLLDLTEQIPACHPTNVLGGELECCCLQSRTGFYRGATRRFLAAANRLGWNRDLLQKP